MPPSRRPERPTPAQLAAAAGSTVPDVIGPGLRVLFCGINPGLWSGAVGHHFARPGNRFWPALAGSGFTDGQLEPAEEDRLLAAGLGVTNLVMRATATADELRPDELVAGAAALEAKAAEHRPKFVAVLGIGAYRTGFGRRNARIGRQPELLAASGLWVLPNPSGLNAHYQLAGLVGAFAELRDAAG
jgi:TDG/mug DNA glycosylase family protein